MLTQFTLVRHGEPKYSHCLLGRTDPTLTMTGWDQLTKVCDPLIVDRIISSPLLRCAEFAQSLSQRRGFEISLDDQLQEIDFGTWDGMPLTDLWKLPNNAFEKYWQQPWLNSPPCGESSEQAFERVKAALLALAARHQGEHLLILTHSGVMRLLLFWLLGGIEPKLAQGNVHLSRVELNYAATLSLSIYRDDTGLLWPQLLGFNNPHTMSEC